MVTKFRVAFAVLAMLVLAGGSATAQPSGPLPPVERKPVRIMFAGDSIALGAPVACPDGQPFGDRWTLGHWLHDAAGLDVAFVGSQTAECAAPYGRSEGYSGWTIGMLANHIGEFLRAHPADVLVLRVGVNDTTSTSNWRSAQQMWADYLRLIDNARAANPTIRIGASEIIPPGPMATTDPAIRADLAKASVTAKEFNAGLRLLLAPYGDSVRIVRLGMITPALLADGLHPSGQGYDAIAFLEMEDPEGIYRFLSDQPAPAVSFQGLLFAPDWRL